jgi:FAD binding domain
VRPRLIIGADGRTSTVRRQSGIHIKKAPATHVVAGLLADGASRWPDDQYAIGVERDLLFYVFPQGDGRVRLYTCHANEQAARWAGRTGPQRFIEAFAALRAIPESLGLGDVMPAGPCATFSGEQAWCDEPYADGVVLLGDAGGYDDPAPARACRWRCATHGNGEGGHGALGERGTDRSVPRRPEPSGELAGDFGRSSSGLTPRRPRDASRPSYPGLPPRRIAGDHHRVLGAGHGCSVSLPWADRPVRSGKRLFFIPNGPLRPFPGRPPAVVGRIITAADAADGSARAHWGTSLRKRGWIS